MAGKYRGWIRTSQPSWDSFCLLIQETCGLALSWWKIVFCWLILDACHRLLLSVGLIGSGTFWNQSFGFPEGAHNRRLPSSPTIYTTSPSLDEDWTLVWLVVVHFTCLMISSIPQYGTVSTFHRLSQFVLKMECFCYVLENCIWRPNQEAFFRLCWLQILKQLT